MRTTPRDEEDATEEDEEEDDETTDTDLRGQRTQTRGISVMIR